MGTPVPSPTHVLVTVTSSTKVPTVVPTPLPTMLPTPTYVVEGTIQQTVQQFCTFLSRGDGDSAFNLLSSSYQKSAFNGNINAF